MSFQGQQVTYTCSDPSVVVLGTPTVQGTTMTLVQGTVTNAAVTAANTRTINITRVNLEDGTVCGPATGAAISVGGERMNYTCGDPSVGLIGDIDTGPPLWSIEKVVLGANQAVQSTEHGGDSEHANRVWDAARPNPTADRERHRHPAAQRRLVRVGGQRSDGQLQWPARQLQLRPGVEQRDERHPWPTHVQQRGVDRHYRHRRPVQ